MSATEPPEEPKEPQGPKEPRKAHEADSGFRDGDRSLAIAAFAVAISALLATLVVLSFRSWILWGVLTATFIVASVPLIKSLRKWKYISHAYALLCAILVIALYVNIADRNDNTPKAKLAATAASTARPPIEINSPLPNAAVPRCLDVSGEAKLSTGDAIWILVQGADPTVYYPEGQAITSPSQGRPGWVDWNYDPTRVGSSDSSANYKIYAVVVDSTTSSFMANLEYAVPNKKNVTTYAKDIDTQADPDLPPNLNYAYRDVSRTKDDVGDCE